MDCNNEKAIGASKAPSPLSDPARRSVYEKRMPIKKRAWKLDARVGSDNDNEIIGQGEACCLPTLENVSTRCPRCDFEIPMKRSRCSGSSNVSNDGSGALPKVHGWKTVIPSDTDFDKDKEEKLKGSRVFKECVVDENAINVARKEVAAVEQPEIDKQKPVDEYIEIPSSKFRNGKDEKKLEGSDIFRESFFNRNDIDENGKEVKVVEHNGEQLEVMSILETEHFEVSSSDIDEDKEEEIQEGSDTFKDTFADENDVKQNGKEETAIKHDAERLEADGNKEPKNEYIEVPDSGFYEFDKDRSADRFVSDHLWAVYDSKDGMPRLYALIRRVFTPEFKMRITWLDAYPDDNYEMDCVGEDLRISCGKFRYGESEITENINMFSHSINYEKSAHRGLLLIYPRKGETWALFRNRGTETKSDPESYRNYEVDFVEIVSDYDKGFGITVAYLEKLEGYINLFKQKAGVASVQIPPNELYKFSHMVPSYRDSLRDGIFELDPASLPANLVEDIGARSIVPQQRTNGVRKETKPGNTFANMSRSQLTNVNNLHKGWNQVLLNRQTFWTSCPFCKLKQQYHQDVLNRVLQCRNCLHPFVAYGLNSQDPPARAPISKSRRQFRSDNLHREAKRSGSTFWTACPYCSVRYQYYRGILSRPVHCQNCMKRFIAYALDV